MIGSWRSRGEKGIWLKSLDKEEGGEGGAGGGKKAKKMRHKRSGDGVCFPSGWWWATAASINTCLHGSHISCFTSHPSTGPHKRRTPQQAESVCVCV